MTDPVSSLHARTRALVGSSSAPAREVSGRDASAFGDFMARLLRDRRGLVTDCRAFVVLPLFAADGYPSVREWNRSGWRARYADVLGDGVCFAMDLFGMQYVWTPDAVRKLNPEDGELTTLSSASAAAFAEAMIRDWEIETGAPLAADWRAEKGPLTGMQRLVPRAPFLLGGGFEVENLVSLPAAAALSILGEMKEQVAGVPNGTGVRLRWSPDSEGGATDRSGSTGPRSR